MKDFEKNLKELEKIVEKMEDEIPLEEALKLFEKGVSLSKSCHELLKKAEQKVKILSDSESLKTGDFKSDHES